MKSPLVSIVIPVFNRQNTIENTVNSVINQKYKNWECLIVDDGSTDSTLIVVEEIIKKDSRIALMLRDSGLKGANRCRNIGMVNSQGKYIALLDSDDLWPVDYLEKAVNLAETKDDFQASYSGAEINHGNQNYTRSSRAIQEGESAFDFLISSTGFAPTPSYFIKNNLRPEILFDESLQRHQDWDFFIRFAKEFNWTFNPYTKVLVQWPTTRNQLIDFESCLTVYRRHRDSITNEANHTDYLEFMYRLAVNKKAAQSILDTYKNYLLDLGWSYRITLKNVLLYKIPRLFPIISKMNRRLFSKNKD